MKPQNDASNKSESGVIRSTAEAGNDPTVVRIYCILCHTLRDANEVFRTGFVSVDSTTYPMGICSMHDASERIAIQCKPDFQAQDEPPAED